ncbi:HK97 family phage prohead protease [Shewanella algae]|uniref:HK97 family phage prohead protease n=1 Tax=Shewanella algae TaxID=38313 RepID=UPI0030064662
MTDTKKGLEREIKYLHTEFKMIESNSDEGYLEGYLATWDMDRSFDVIRKGAFKNTINDFKNVKKRHFPLCIEHDSEKVAGHWDVNTLVEDEKGLYGRAYFNMETERGREWYSHVKRMGGYGLSIGYVTVNANWKTDVIRELIELEIFETSLVAIAMNSKAEVTEVKTIRDLEKGLKELGFSNTQSKEIIAKYKSKDPESEKVIEETKTTGDDQGLDYLGETESKNEIEEVKEDLTEIKSLLSQLTNAFK